MNLFYELQTAYLTSLLECLIGISNIACPQMNSLPSSPNLLHHRLPTSANNNSILTIGQAKNLGTVLEPLSHATISNMLKNPIGSTSKDMQQLSTSLHISDHPGSDLVISHLARCRCSDQEHSSLVSLLLPSSSQSVFQPEGVLFKGKALEQLSIASEQKSLGSPQRIWPSFLSDIPTHPFPAACPAPASLASSGFP